MEENPFTDEALDISIAEFKERAAEVLELRRIKLEAEARAEIAKSEYTAASDRLFNLMLDIGLTRFDTDDSFITPTEIEYVNVPSLPEDKEALFTWLKQQGVFYDYVTINHNKLQSLWREVHSRDQSLPGVQKEPYVRKKLSIRSRSS